MDYLLEIKGLTKRFGKTLVLDGFDLNVARGETVVITGPSGCGKSTALRCINRLTEPDSGSITFAGVDITRLSYSDLLRVRRRIGFVFQHFNLIERLTALQNVMLGVIFEGVPYPEARDMALRALARVGIGEMLACRRPSELSGGERQRVGIARALVMDPDLMLWDEPTASLDPILVVDVLDVMEELVKTSGKTMIIVTHEMKFASRVADRIVLLDRGRVAEEGPPGEVFLAPKSEIGRRYKRLLAG
ncbi:MAG TPA: amino acid ABC transporter ATP-binding protein [Firmicutes bacterium]|nr:amino acid ABC transporter ATP-binding protein [Bacillota bacterium]